jgi:hypothetical protein
VGRPTTCHAFGVNCADGAGGNHVKKRCERKRERERKRKRKRKRGREGERERGREGKG